MNRTATFVACIALGSMALSAQHKPDFSGVWVAVSPARFAGQQITVVHDETSLTVLQGTEPGQEHGNIYQLDGKPERDVQKSSGQEVVTVTTASWSADRVVVVRTITVSGGARVVSTLTFSLNARGELLQQVTDVLNGTAQPPVSMVSRKKQ